jgi:RNA-directed DNA polymerase
LNLLLGVCFVFLKIDNPFFLNWLVGFIGGVLLAIFGMLLKRPRMGHCHADHKRWPNVYFAGHGLFTMTEAHALACRSR